MNYSVLMQDYLKLCYNEDQLGSNVNYLTSLSEEAVNCQLKFKDDLVIAGLPFFFESINYLMNEKIDYREYLKHEGEFVNRSDHKELHFSLPFNIALSAERVALNLLQRASSIATYTHKFTSIAKNIKILDTRKTTPGLRFVEKYGVIKGGGHNHRFSQSDVWMIKDNHKSFYGGVANAIEKFKSLNTFYQPIVVEIHTVEELVDVANLGVKHFMLDNFSPSEIEKAVSLKKEGWSYEVSGGINLDNLEKYLITGVDAISSGSITYNAPQVDISLKYNR